MSWIPIGEPDVPRLSFDAEKVFSIMQCMDKPHIGIIRMKTRFGDDRIMEAIYEIRKMEAIRMGKLTNQQRAAIYAASKDGVPQKDLAQQYGVSVQAISQLCAKLAKAEQEIMQPAAEDKPKPGIINPEFDAAVDAMIAESKAADAEKPSANAEPEKIPHVIWCALDDQCSEINMELETREQRIAELQEEIAKLQKMKHEIQEWMEART